MKIYSIVRIGSEYVVQAGENSVLKVASRRIAVQVVSDAAELLATPPAPPLSGQQQVAPSIIRDPGITPDPTGITPDPSGVMPDRSEAP